MKNLNDDTERTKKLYMDNLAHYQRLNQHLFDKNITHNQHSI